MNRKKVKNLAILNALAFIAVITINALANILPINGINTGELSDAIPNLFVPSGLTFSIWALIYILLAIYIIYNFVVIKGRKSSQFIEDISYLFIINSAANFGWILAWHYQKLLISLLLMIVILGTLILINRRISNKRRKDSVEKFAVNLPFSIYLGWISVATIANVTAVLVTYKWNGFGISEQIWTVVVIAVAIALALVSILKENDIAYALVVDWALLGIFIKRYGLEGLKYPGIIGATIIGMLLITFFSIYKLLNRRKSKFS